MKRFLIGGLIGISTWIVLAVISCTIYNMVGMLDILVLHPIMWATSISIASISLDNLIIRKIM